MSGYVGRLQRYLAEIVPEFLQGPHAGAFLEAVGLTLDNNLQTLVTALRQAYPLRAFPESLAVIGADRGLRRYPNEATESYRLRLAQWRQILSNAGSPKGAMLNLQPYFLPGAAPRIRIVYQAGDGSSATWHTLQPNGTYEVYRKVPSNWSWDASPALWARYWVIIYATGVGSDAVEYDDGVTEYDDGTAVFDGHLNASQIADVVALIKEFKAPYSQLQGVFLASDPTSFDPTSSPVTLPDGSTSLPAGNWFVESDPVTGFPTRLDTATLIFYEGVA